MQRQLRFGNSTAVFINDLNIKNKIIDFLFDSLDLKKYRYVMLNNDHQKKFKYLKQNNHYVSPNYKGYNYFLLFTIINKNNYCVIIDKKKLSYHKNQIDIKNIPIIKVKIMTSKSIFNGSIFDCKFIRNKNSSIMLLKDCFYIMGNCILDMEMKNKMIYLDNIIKNQFNDDPCDNFKILINKLFDYKDLKKLVKEIIPSCSFASQGLVFFPKFSGITIIHIEKKIEKVNITTNVKNDSYHMIYNLVNFLKSRTYSYENDGKSKKMFLKKTEITDVYDVYEKEDGERLGIAHIPNLKISHMCQNLIKNEFVEFNCIYNKKFNKWTPIKSI
jgi:hypothetical protein